LKVINRFLKLDPGLKFQVAAEVYPICNAIFVNGVLIVVCKFFCRPKKNIPGLSCN